MQAKVKAEAKNDKPSLNQLTYARLTIRQLWDNLPQVIWLGCILTGLSLPALSLFILGLGLPALALGVVTIVPTWAALLAQETKLVQEKTISLGGLFKVWPRYWGRSVRLGLLAAFPIAIALLTLPALAQPDVPLIVWFGLAADAFGLLLLIALFIYTFPLLVLYDLELKEALGNAFILVGRYLSNTLGLLSLGILFSLSVIFFSLALFLILPAIWGLFIINNCRLVVSLEEGMGS